MVRRVLPRSRRQAVTWCERIALVRDGRIVDIGPYEDLLARSREFQQLAR